MMFPEDVAKKCVQEEWFWARRWQWWLGRAASHFGFQKNEGLLGDGLPLVGE